MKSTETRGLKPTSRLAEASQDSHRQPTLKDARPPANHADTRSKQCTGSVGKEWYTYAWDFALSLSPHPAPDLHTCQQMSNQKETTHGVVLGRCRPRTLQPFRRRRRRRCLPLVATYVRADDPISTKRRCRYRCCCGCRHLRARSRQGFSFFFSSSSFIFVARAEVDCFSPHRGTGSERHRCFVAGSA